MTAMLLPENGVSDLKAENASVITEMGKQILVGYAIPCADAALNLPSSFTVSFHADHADLGWMMTVVSSGPIHLACKAIDEKTDTDNLHTELDEAAAVLSAMSRNETLPETDGKSKEIVRKLNELNDGLVQLDNGAFLLAQGADTLYTNGTQLLKKSILDAEAELARTLLPYAQDSLPEALRVFETTRDATQNAHYDLAPEGIRTTTLCLIRTDL